VKNSFQFFSLSVFDCSEFAALGFRFLERTSFLLFRSLAQNFLSNCVDHAVEIRAHRCGSQETFKISALYYNFASDTERGKLIAVDESL
jgi:hypothetical protein